MRKLKIQLAAALASAAMLLLGACGQAGPLYLPDQGTHKNKSLKREQRAKTAGTTPAPVSDDASGTAAPANSPAPSSPTPAAPSPSSPPVAAPNQPPNQP